MTEGFNRRRFLQSAAGCLVLSSSGVAARGMGFVGDDPINTPLRTLAERKGLLFGTEATVADLGDQQYADIAVSTQCDLLVPGLALKWDALRPAPDTFDFSQGDWTLRYTQQHNMKMRGHTLVWYLALPKWFSSYATPQNAKQLLLNHINTVVTHYAGNIHSWDVINEALLPTDNRPDGLRNSPWLQLIGPDYIEMAFRAAAAADPKAILCWNEYGIENESAANETKRQFFLQHLKDLQKRNVPIQAIGIQSHLNANDPEFSGAKFDYFLHQVTDMGFKIIITEMDFVDYLPDPDVNKRNQLIATRYEQYLDLVLKHKSAIAVLTWGLTDRHTWLNSGYKFPRKDNAPMLPLPFDSNMNVKPAWNGIARALETAPQR